MDKIIGFIGSGNMGGAIIGGIVNSGLVNVKNILASAISEDTLQKLNATYGIKTTNHNLVVAQVADILFLAVKPNIYPIVIKQIKGMIKENVIIVVIAAGQTIQMVEELFDRQIKIVRTMPNTPALVGAGMTAITPNRLVTSKELDEIVAIFNSIGKSQIVEEYLLDAVIGVSGSSPAYVYMFIEALADAAVAEGMPRKQAYEFAAQAVYGSAKMVLDTKEHPGTLKDQVCSPGGTTIEAVCELENKGFRAAVIAAVRKCIEKAKMMSKK